MHWFWQGVWIWPTIRVLLGEEKEAKVIREQQKICNQRLVSVLSAAASCLLLRARAEVRVSTSSSKGGARKGF